MKQPQTIALTAVIAVAVGMIGINSSFGDIFGLDNNPEVTSESQAYKGHVTIRHFDSEGNIKSYQQMDNVVTFTGKNCAANLLFDNTLGSCAAGGALFDDIAISITAINNTGFLTNDDSVTTLDGECDGTTDDCGTGLNVRQAALVTLPTPAADNVDAIVDLDGTFAKTGGNPVTIQSAGLFNALPTETGEVFAVRPFSSPVNMISGDSLAVTWSITLS